MGAAVFSADALVIHIHGAAAARACCCEDQECWLRWQLGGPPSWPQRCDGCWQLGGSPAGRNAPLMSWAERPSLAVPCALDSPVTARAAHHLLVLEPLAAAAAELGVALAAHRKLVVAPGALHAHHCGLRRIGGCGPGRGAAAVTGLVSRFPGLLMIRAVFALLGAGAAPTAGVAVFAPPLPTGRRTAWGLLVRL